MRTFEELDNRYNDLAWLEDTDIAQFKNQAKALDLQKEVMVTFSRMNYLVFRGQASEEDGSESHLLLNQAVTHLEALDKLYKEVRLG